MGRIAVLFAFGVFAMQGMPQAIAQQASPKKTHITKLSQLRPLPNKVKPQPPEYVIPKGEGDAYVPPPLKSNFGHTPSTLNLSGDDNLQAQQPYLGAYSPQIEARALRMFPSVSQEFERQQWMAEQEQLAIANEINRTKPLVYPVGSR